MTELAPFRIEPRFVERVWGFRDLRPWYDRMAQSDPIGEVWLTGDDCLVATGPYAGKRLAALFAENRQALLGAGALSPDSPLLIKIIFASEKLSVQVHPDDELARQQGCPRGKTECWYALAAEPDAAVAVGVKAGTTLAAIREGIQHGTLEARLNALSIAAGEMIFVDAGTIHAIWPGSILLETQQNCDLTYRMFDYGRQRELHVAKSLEATKLATRAGKVAPRVLADRTLLIDSEYFRVERVPVAGSRNSASLRGSDMPGLAYLFAAAGAARIHGAGFAPVDLPPRGIVAVPALSPEYTIEDVGVSPSNAGEKLNLIRIAPNWRSAQ
jgi:mannose-6-phosphate isomerase